MSNNVTLIGNLVDDPELRFTPSGVALAKIRMAVNRRWRGQDGEWQEQTSFFGGTIWREQAEQVAESLQKGARVIVSGRLEQRSWETDAGDKRSIVEVQIDEIGPSLRWATATVNRTQRNDDFRQTVSRAMVPKPHRPLAMSTGPTRPPSRSNCKWEEKTRETHVAQFGVGVKTSVEVVPSHASFAMGIRLTGRTPQPFVSTCRIGARSEVGVRPGFAPVTSVR